MLVSKVLKCRFVNPTKKKLDMLNKEDLETLRGLEKAWKQIEEGKYKKYTREEFLKKLEKW